jgi:hypothetical protein
MESTWTPDVDQQAVAQLERAWATDHRWAGV